MVIIEMSGGLGNQMFQYALYKAFEEKEKSVSVDTSFFESGQELRKIEILNFPNVSFTEEKIKNVNLIRGYGYHDSFLNKVFYLFHKGERKIYEENIDKGYQPEIFDLQNVYLSGYWQSDLYFRDVSQKIRKDFFVSDASLWSMSKEFAKMLNQIRITESISVHIRRGDYLQENLQKIYGNICTKEYYIKAITFIQEKLDNPVFFLFSDDVNWVRKNIFIEGMIIVNEKNEWNGFYDLFLMQNCKNHIIANSSFSWWGAWLGQEKNQITISPSRWFNNHLQTDMICREWIKI